MTLEKIDVVDAIGIEKESGLVVLTLADSWDWADEHKHLLTLQAKLNAYFEFIATEQIWDAYPVERGKPLVIDVVFRFSPPPAVRDLLAEAGVVAGDLGVVVRHRTFEGEK